MVKIVSVIHAPSVARESLFYEFVLPSLDALKGLVPKYFGTFVGGNGGWFAIVLEDCGTRVSAGDEWPVEDVELMGKIRYVCSPSSIFSQVTKLMRALCFQRVVN